MKDVSKYLIAGVLSEGLNDGLNEVELAQAVLDVLEDARAERESHTVRHLRWSLKHANKERGRMSTRIHELKGEVALLREVNRDKVVEAVADDWWPTEDHAKGLVGQPLISNGYVGANHAD
ncbi:hypothetical protein HOT82_gp029 [Gordonia phage Ronaldo]|uniref:Uncharacterized protein n=4 Tax=Ronaldovirus TaxID=2733205 RepID=A0A6B9LGF8_9CAUD|nr:hypothetical protein HOT81_gp026 [Gordonia phage Fryberger]YP_009807725.1 hypothetical protein HOT82_gp029 [Gordonia phage Ronaldo]QDH48368.1 hypothetical protein SEA_ZIKO_29 [Gordonia phage Ziko]QHB38145.1 hypothetical protein SEA_VOLT_28 [Gordonia phage Volt]AXN53444.1 hypothetical protein SEA_FRYBERGER_26 [Gordonia phage Fryberger]AXN53591.1 hypothetical protein SEA_RONALDO_29 [Gordonia phage Ronaldo]